jgi:hypothetical protein
MKTLVLRAFSFLVSISLLQSAVHAAETNPPPPRLTVKLRDGSRVVGTSAEKNFKFHSALLGEIKLDVKDLRVIDFAATNSAKLVTTGGDELTIAFTESEIAVKTGFGKVELAVNSIQKISVTTGSRGGHPAGLVALWSGEDNGKDSAGNNDLELTEVAFADGQVGRAFALNGFSSCMKLADTPGLNPGTGDGLTVSAWIRPNNVSGFHPILEWNPSDKMPGQVGVQLWIGNVPGSRGVLAAYLVGREGESGSFAPHSLISRPGTVVTDRFQHVAVTYDKTSGTGVLYVNGVVMAREQWGSFDPLTTGDLWISRRPTDHPGDWTYNAFFGGLLDEIAIYNRALSAVEIKDIGVAENHGEPLAPPPSPTRPGFLPGYNGVAPSRSLP